MGEALEETDAETLENDPDLDEGLAARQLQALDKLEEYRRQGMEGAVPHEEGMPYHSEPKIRALQLVAEGRLGGYQGAGKKGIKKKSANELVADWVRTQKFTDIKRAFERALDADSERTAMDAASRLLDLESKELDRRLRAEEIDLDAMNKEELIAALFTILTDQETVGAIEGSLAEIAAPIQEAEVVGKEDDFREAERGANGSAAAPKVRVRSRAPAQNGRGRSAGASSSSPNPFKEAARRRAAERRRAARMDQAESQA